ncbi:hypothetical protein H9P43_002452 [Blastocladiella emersonii ATCC 22665]|nr:hypothetical protein H9P43_002452 [Blastocladiella emersonii ATCC 22665]
MRSVDEHGNETMVSTLLEPSGDVLLATEVNNPHRDDGTRTSYQRIGCVDALGRIAFDSPDYAQWADWVIPPAYADSAPADDDGLLPSYGSTHEATRALIARTPGALRRSLFRNRNRNSTLSALSSLSLSRGGAGGSIPTASIEGADADGLSELGGPTSPVVVTSPRAPPVPEIPAKSLARPRRTSSMAAIDADLPRPVVPDTSAVGSSTVAVAPSSPSTTASGPRVLSVDMSAFDRATLPRALPPTLERSRANSEPVPPMPMLPSQTRGRGLPIVARAPDESVLPDSELQVSLADLSLGRALDPVTPRTAAASAVAASLMSSSAPAGRSTLKSRSSRAKQQDSPPILSFTDLAVPPQLLPPQLPELSVGGSSLPSMLPMTLSRSGVPTEAPIDIELPPMEFMSDLHILDLEPLPSPSAASLTSPPPSGPTTFPPRKSSIRRNERPKFLAPPPQSTLARSGVSSSSGTGTESGSSAASGGASSLAGQVGVDPAAPSPLRRSPSDGHPSASAAIAQAAGTAPVLRRQVSLPSPRAHATAAATTFTHATLSSSVAATSGESSVASNSTASRTPAPAPTPAPAAVAPALRGRTFSESQDIMPVSGMDLDEDSDEGARRSTSSGGRPRLGSSSASGTSSPGLFGRLRRALNPGSREPSQDGTSGSESHGSGTEDNVGGTVARAFSRVASLRRKVSNPKMAQHRTTAPGAPPVPKLPATSRSTTPVSTASRSPPRSYSDSAAQQPTQYAGYHQDYFHQQQQPYSEHQQYAGQTSKSPVAAEFMDEMVAATLPRGRGRGNSNAAAPLAMMITGDPIVPLTLAPIVSPTLASGAANDDDQDPHHHHHHHHGPPPGYDEAVYMYGYNTDPAAYYAMHQHGHHHHHEHGGDAGRGGDGGAGEGDELMAAHSIAFATTHRTHRDGQLGQVMMMASHPI